MLYTNSQIVVMLSLAFCLGVVIGAFTSYLYWRKRLPVKGNKSTPYLRTFIILLVSLVWGILTISSALFETTPVNPLMYPLMGGVLGAVLGDDFIKFFYRGRINPISQSTNIKDDPNT